MKILRIVLPIAAFGLLSSFAVSTISSKTKSTASIVSVNKIDKKLPVDPTYKEFIEKFDKVDLPYSVQFDKPAFSSAYENPKVEKTDNSKYLGASYAEILPEIKNGMMSRMGPDDFFAEALLKTAEKYDVVIYSRKRSFRGPKSYYAASFNKKGKIISKIEIGEFNYENLKEFSVSKDFIITVDNIKIRSKYDEAIRKTKNSYAKTGNEVYYINTEGRFVNKDAAADSDLGMN